MCFHLFVYLFICINHITSYLLQQPWINVNAKSPSGRTALSTAVMDRSVAIVDLICHHPLCDTNIQDLNGSTALHEACLLKPPPPLPLETRKSNFSLSVFPLFAESVSDDHVMLNDCSDNCASRAETTTTWSYLDSQMSIVQLLLSSYNPPDLSLVNSMGWTPVHCSAYTHPSIFHLLLSYCHHYSLNQKQHPIEPPPHLCPLAISPPPVAPTNSSLLALPPSPTRNPPRLSHHHCCSELDSALNNHGSTRGVREATSTRDTQLLALPPLRVPTHTLPSSNPSTPAIKETQSMSSTSDGASFSPPRDKLRVGQPLLQSPRRGSIQSQQGPSDVSACRHTLPPLRQQSQKLSAVFPLSSTIAGRPLFNQPQSVNPLRLPVMLSTSREACTTSATYGTTSAVPLAASSPRERRATRLRQVSPQRSRSDWSSPRHMDTSQHNQKERMLSRQTTLSLPLYKDSVPHNQQHLQCPALQQKQQNLSCESRLSLSPTTKTTLPGGTPAVPCLALTDNGENPVALHAESAHCAMICSTHGQTHSIVRTAYSSSAIVPATAMRRGYTRYEGTTFPAAVVSNCDSTVGSSMLHLAINGASLPAVQAVLASCWACPVTPSRLGVRPLMLAVKVGLLDVVSLLLSFPQVVREINSTDIFGNTALHVAADRKDAVALSLLMSKGASIGLRNVLGHTPLQALEREAANESCNAAQANLIAECVTILTRCGHCGCGGGSVVCFKCGGQRYCSLDCQRKHWHTHKGVCPSYRLM
eukprot:GHVQ01022946.1.p1 GENE.GHVQ01022946.1~~GHVQ01022946.1.p1  ORF type:complete len:758 (-),score=132.44 GHVQ01022946.1:441-2714(-)